MNFPFADLTLARRLERCEATANAAFVEARSRVQRGIGAGWIDVNGAYAMFDGIDSPLTQTFSFGLFATPTNDDLDRIEEFFTTRGAPILHEISPLAATETMPLLVARGYHPMELSTVLFQPIVPPPESTGRVQTRLATKSDEEIELWARTAAEGWRSELGELGDFMHDLAKVSASSAGSSSFFAEIDGEVVGAGALIMHEGIALMAGASTVPPARNQGAQRALLEARLRHAAAHGCDLAMMATAPGTTSQRNAERRGFRIAYTRTKWGR
ncbi:MAG: hypothetical protein QOH21_1751 [Acidobacteriota bacterium]|nr:hypothetical protein [Acidobacteriota bacterium]